MNCLLPLHGIYQIALGISSQSNDINVKTAKRLEQINNIQANLVIYTNG